MKTVCIDFDGVLNTYDGWKGEDELFNPREKVEWFLKQLRQAGYEIVIHSTRTPSKIRKWRNGS